MHKKDLVPKILNLATAGLCSYDFAAKHEFLKDIQKLCMEQGYDILGEPINKTARSRALLSFGKSTPASRRKPRRPSTSPG